MSARANMIFFFIFAVLLVAHLVVAFTIATYPAINLLMAVAMAWFAVKHWKGWRDA